MNHSWKYTFFIARQLHKKQDNPVSQPGGGTRAARPITRIATLSIALAMIVNIITIAVVNGFQQEVRRKVTGFGSQLTIQSATSYSLFESEPLRRNSRLEKELKGIREIRSVQPVGYKPALLQSVAKDRQKEISGVVMKGVNEGYDWSFVRQYLKQGRIPNYKNPESTEIVVSKATASDLHYRLGDTVKAYFVKQRPILRNFIICGIYETGYEELDKKLVFCSLYHVQRLNDWGIQAEIAISDTLYRGDLLIHGQVSGGNGNFRYNWGDGFETYSFIPTCPWKDSTYRLIGADYYNSLNEPPGSEDLRIGETAIPDTAYLEIKISGNKLASCQPKLNENGEVVKNFLDATGNVYTIDAGEKTICFTSIPGKGSSANYLSAYEINLNDGSDMAVAQKKITRLLLQFATQSNHLKVKSIEDQQKELFIWLSFLDLNMAIILFLMILIGVINMGSAFLVMVLTKTNFIGILKSMGATNQLIRRIFIVQAGRLILLGMLWGNGIGLALYFLQQQFGIVPLDPKVYYLSQVPVELNPFGMLGLNILTLAICLFSLLLPAIVISRISPAKSIRFR